VITLAGMTHKNASETRDEDIPSRDEMDEMAGDGSEGAETESGEEAADLAIVTLLSVLEDYKNVNRELHARLLESNKTAETAAKSDTAEVVRVLGDIGLQYMRDRKQEEAAERERVSKKGAELLAQVTPVLVEAFMRGKREVVFKGKDEPEVDVTPGATEEA
jgi:phosphoenolpyruvate-protein kinase (PTS system EI component)